MATLANILENHFGDERRFKRAVRTYMNSVVKELNSTLKLDFRLKSSLVNIDSVLDVEATISNNEYSFLLFMYYYPTDIQYCLYRLIEWGPLTSPMGPKVDVEFTATPKEVATYIFGLIEPRDIVKSRRNPS